MRKRMSGQGKNDIEERTKKKPYEVVINGHGGIECVRSETSWPVIGVGVVYMCLWLESG